nr:glutamate-cysteine ligase [Tanacetum cinerariifolium]
MAQHGYVPSNSLTASPWEIGARAHGMFERGEGVILHSRDFTSPPERIYRFATVDRYDLVDRDQFSVDVYDVLLTGLGNTCPSGGDEADRKRFIDLDEDLFQQANDDDNVDDAENEEEDYIDMVDELQQGNKDVVFGNIDLGNTDVVFGYNAQEVDEEVVDREEHVVDDTSEPKTVDEIDESEIKRHFEIRVADGGPWRRLCALLAFWERRRSKQPFILEESPIDRMADQRTMAELLRAPTEGYAEAIVVPLILDEQFELKHSLINMKTSD